MHSRRILVAAVVLPLLILLIKFLPSGLFFFLVLFAALGAQYEFYRIYRSENCLGMILFGLSCTSLLLAHFYYPGFPGERESLTLLVAVILLHQLAAKRNLSSTLTDASVTLMGVFYVGWLMGHLILIREVGGGEDLILFLLLVTWAGDAGAYYFGKAFGRRPLAPRVSPNKTIEGALGGLASGVAVVWLGQQIFLPMLSMGEVVFLGLFLGVLGMFGDLTESMFKRSAGIKDSGGWIPAHGGLLDKVDSLLFTAPALYYYLLWVKGVGRSFII